MKNDRQTDSEGLGASPGPNPLADCSLVRPSGGDELEEHPRFGDVYFTEHGPREISIVILGRTDSVVDALVFNDPWYPLWHRRTLKLPIPERFVRQDVPQA